MDRQQLRSGWVISLLASELGELSQALWCAPAGQGDFKESMVFPQETGWL